MNLQKCSRREFEEGGKESKSIIQNRDQTGRSKRWEQEGPDTGRPSLIDERGTLLF